MVLVRRVIAVFLNARIKISLLNVREFDVIGREVEKKHDLGVKYPNITFRSHWLAEQMGGACGQGEPIIRPSPL